MDFTELLDWIGIKIPVFCYLLVNSTCCQSSKNCCIHLYLEHAALGLLRWLFGSRCQKQFSTPISWLVLVVQMVCQAFSISNDITKENVVTGKISQNSILDYYLYLQTHWCPRTRKQYVTDVYKQEVFIHVRIWTVFKSFIPMG